MRTRKILRYNALKRSHTLRGESVPWTQSDTASPIRLLPKVTVSSDTLSLPENAWEPTPGAVSLDTLMQVHRDKLATDPRDKVYAFVGLADTKTSVCGAPATSVRPDYELPVQDVYTRLMAQLLLAHGDLHLLYHVQDPTLTKLEGLPSWVPDSSVQLVPYPLRGHGAASWSACGNARWQPPSSDEDMRRGIIRVQGSKIGVVKETALLQNEAECSAEYWASIVNLALGLSEQYPQLPKLDSSRCKASVSPGNPLADVDNRHVLTPASCPRYLRGHVHGVHPESTDQAHPRAMVRCRLHAPSEPHPRSSHPTPLARPDQVRIRGPLRVQESHVDHDGKHLPGHILAHESGRTPT